MGLGGLVGRALAAALAACLAASPAAAQGFGSGPGGSAAPLAPLAPDNPFQDVPADHWALDALRRLARSGMLKDIAPDGDPFRGKKVLTRYELAVLVARLVEKVEAAERAGEDVTEEERLVRDLTREFRQELAILGIRVDAFTNRLEVQERRLGDLERRRSNIRMEGFYRVTQHFVDQPTPLANFRQDFDLRPFRDIENTRGLTPLEQEVFLRMIGQASPGNALPEGAEAFAEIKARLNGPLDDTLQYGFGTPGAGDGDTDSFATSIRDDRRVTLNRGHLVARTPFLDLRLFANEAPTEPGDPSRLFSVDPGRAIGTPASVRVPDPFVAFSGIEAGQEKGKWSYFGSALEDRRELYIDPNHYDPNGLDPGTFGQDPFRRPRDGFPVFTPSRIDQVDNYALRLTYEPWGTRAGSGRDLLVGLTYNEVTYGYELDHDRNAVGQVDVQYSKRTSEYELDYTVAALWSDGRGVIDDTAYRADVRYRRGGLLSVLKGYYYGSRFRALNAQDPFIDDDIHHNFLRTRPFEPGPDTIGERLFRTQTRYTFDPARLTTLDDLTLELLYEVKAFDRDNLDPRVNDHEPGSRFRLQAIADIDSRIHVELSSEVQKDIPQPDQLGGLLPEEGTLTNTFRVDYRPVRKVGLTGELSFIDDFDSRDEDGTHFQFQRKRTEISVQPTPAVFLKGTFEGIDNSDLTLTGLPRNFVNGRDIHRFIGEGNFVVANNFGIKGLFVNQRTDNTGVTGFGAVTGGPPPGGGESNLSQIYQAEAAWQLSRALQLRYVYGLQDTNLDQSDEGSAADLLDDFVNINNYVELRYNPTEITEVLFTYGDEYENPADPTDNGPATFGRTARVYRLRAQTNF